MLRFTMSTMNKKNHPVRRRIHLIELLVAIAIIAILAALLLPVLNRVKERAQKNFMPFKSFGSAAWHCKFTRGHNDFYPLAPDPNVDVIGNPESAEAGTDLWDLPNAMAHRIVNELGQNRLLMYCPSSTTSKDVRNEATISYCWNFDSVPPHTSDGPV